MRVSVFIALFMLLPGLSLAQSSNRANSWEFAFGGIYQNGDSASGNGGSSLEVDGEFGLGFNVGYNFSNRFALSADFDFLRPDYTAVLADENDPGSTQTIRHSMSQFNGRFKGAFNFMEGPFTPYVELGAGWTYIDSNVADGPPVTGCWWHPWWGYICSDYYSTYSGTDFSYGGALGLRYEMRGGTFVKASYSIYKLDVGNNGAADPELSAFRLEYGWRF